MERLGDFRESRKQEILQRNNFTRHFLDYKADPNLRASNLTRESFKLISDIKNKVSSEWEHLTTPAFFAVGDRLNLLNNGLGMDKNAEIIQSLVMIGFEVGSNNEVALIGPEIFSALAYRQFFVNRGRDGFGKDYEELKAKQQFVEAVLIFGIVLKELKITPKPILQPPAPFKNFIDNLDMDGI